MIEIRLHLLVDDGWVDADDALADGSPLRTDACALSLRVDGVEHLLGRWNLGRIDLLVDQVEDCAARLRRGTPGLVRSAVLDRVDVPFHLFDPPAAAGGPAHVSRFFVADREVERWFPVPGWSSHPPGDLFAWVERHRSTLLDPDAVQPDDGPPLLLAPVPSGDLLHALDGVVTVGRRVLARAAAVAADGNAADGTDDAPDWGPDAAGD